ncbi:MAG: thermonuclease family protein [Dehalococcoidia bacterium]|nr:MAG: thermonuclease family protein [Dehalococcoidia bacterium]
MKKLIVLVMMIWVFPSICISCVDLSPSETHESSATPTTATPILLEITSVDPDIVSLGGGNPIKITGEGFQTGAIVTVKQRDQAKAASNVLVSSSTTINCRLPAFSVGFAHITVTNEDGGQITLQNALIYSKLDWQLQLTRATVVRVIDGDTIEVNIEGRLFDVRYIGIDTPEMVHPTQGEEPYGKEAYKKNGELIEGKTVILEKDVSETDQYGRLLRYVYVDDLLVNAELVRLGYAQVSTYPPDLRYQDLFLELQQEARENNRGLWDLESPNQETNPPANGGIKITEIFYDGMVSGTESDEYVEITNLGNEPVNLDGWQLIDMVDGYPEFIFPFFVLQPDTSIRVYTNEIHTEYGGFSFNFQSSVWNNTNPDTAALYDQNGNLVSTKNY